MDLGGQDTCQKYGNIIKIALMNIRSNKATFLSTMLGIIIGISSVILIVSTGSGVKGGVSGQLNDLVGGYVQLYAENDQKNSDYIEFTDEDLDVITEKIDHVKGATDMWMFSEAQTQSTKGTFNTAVTFGNESLQYYNKTKMLKGRYFTKSEYQKASKVCVITEKGAKAFWFHRCIRYGCEYDPLWYYTGIHNSGNQKRQRFCHERHGI